MFQGTVPCRNVVLADNPSFQRHRCTILRRQMAEIQPGGQPPINICASQSLNGTPRIGFVRLRCSHWPHRRGVRLNQDVGILIFRRIDIQSVKRPAEKWFVVVLTQRHQFLQHA